MRISYKTKDCRLIVKVRASFRESFNTKELDRFSRVFLRCFLKPKVLKPSLIEYSGPVGISLENRLKKEITKRDFLFILEHIVVAVQKLSSNNFSLDYLQMDMRHIFINETTKELQFLYVPMIGAVEGSGVIDLINAVIYSAHPAMEKDTEYISRFNYFFSSLKPFDISKIEKFIQREDQTVVNTIKKHNSGQSGFMTSKQKSYYDHIAKKQQGDSDATDLLDEDEYGATGLMNEDEYGDTGLMNEDEYGDTGLMNEDEYGATGLMNEDEYGDTGLMDEDTGLLGGDEEATGLLCGDEAEGTALLEGNEAYPELYRIQTGETISLNKPVFRLGKERSYVDYFVSNNNAVSRSHADIITRDSGYFVVDLNSKNRTYINGQVLAVQAETEIRDGDTLRLANEEFIFRKDPQEQSGRCPHCGSNVSQSSQYCAKCGYSL